MTSAEQDRYEDHRLAQVAIKAGFLAQFAPTFDILDYDRIDETFVPYMQAAMDVVRPWRQASADLAAAEYGEARRLYIPGELANTPAPSVTFSNSNDTDITPTARQVEDRKIKAAPARRTRDRETHIDWKPSDRAAQRSLLVTGPGELKRQVKRGVLREQALKAAKAQTFGAASRHVLNGGRETTLELVDTDPGAIAWVRVTDGDPCAFCALLSSRGPVYKTKETAGFQAHDHCACTAAPVFDRKAPWPGRSREFRDLYNEKVAGQFSGHELRRAFRRFYEDNDDFRAYRAQLRLDAKAREAQASLDGSLSA